ncbi:MAG: RHS repeat-associated core domain-containing protein, partial [Prevotella sp.]|nr:RHS repeat-associated core domain-containing protein [Prevotella sp.]
INHYYPFGMHFAPGTGGELQPYKYNNKELDQMHGLNMYDYSARYYESALGRFTSVDPLAEKYYNISPYAYVMNNPLKYIDPTGGDIVISGALNQDALKQLQAGAGSSITLTMTGNGNVCYTKNIEGNLSFNAQKIASMIDNSSIIVNLNTIDGDKTSTGNLFIGGAFMGNQVYTDQDGNKIVVANQEINPKVLGTADKHTGMPGELIMHETTEAYEGAKISQKSGVSSGNSSATNSVYEQAHNAATSQSPIYQTMYDAKGKITTDPLKAVKVEWSVKTIQDKDKVIQTLQ